MPLRVILVLPPSDGETKGLQKIVNEWAADGGRKLSTARVQSAKSKEGHVLNLLKPDDVRAIYRLCHEEHVLVVALVAARVQLDISERPSKPGSQPLEEFIRYKAHFTRPVDDEGIRGVLDDLSVGERGCEDFRDPRCLPFAVFAPQRMLDLTIAKSRKEFKRTHKVPGSATSLVDAGDRQWSVGEFHTMDLLHVAGCVLPLGFHWDVETRRKWTILNGWERWTLPGTKHVNIHPDGYVRGPNATRTHPVKRGGKPSSARTPAHKRSRKK